MLDHGRPQSTAGGHGSIYANGLLRASVVVASVVYGFRVYCIHDREAFSSALAIYLSAVFDEGRRAMISLRELFGWYSISESSASRCSRISKG